MDLIIIGGAMRYDLAVVGSGAAGFAAAIAARRRGASVVMVEKEKVGGTCVNAGCVPSKALLAAAGSQHAAQSGGRFPGVGTYCREVEFGELMAGKDALVLELRAGRYLELAAEYGWEILAGAARFRGSQDAPYLEVTAAGGSFRVQAEHYLVATGSAPWVPPIDGLATAGYLTSTTALQLPDRPRSMIVVGAGAVGLELSQLFARLGTAVTVVETEDRLAPGEEAEVSAAIRAAFTDEGISTYLGARPSAVGRAAAAVTVRVTGPDGRDLDLRAEQVLFATGRRPATGELGLPEIAVATGARGEVAVDAQLRTSNRRIYAAGDVTGAPQFVYVAAAQGAVAAENALAGTASTIDYTNLPRVTFTSPALAAAGMTAAEAVAAGYRCDCRVLPLAHVPRAIVDRDTRGLVKLVADAGTGRLLGVHAVADGAGELIAAAGYALAAGMTVDQLASLWSPYLTIGEALRLAAQSFTRDVSKLSCCAS